MLARSQTRTHTYASPSLILESLQAPVPYDLQDNQTWRARPHRRSNSARSFPGRPAKLFSTCRLASATRQGAQVLTSFLRSTGLGEPTPQWQVLLCKPAAAGAGTLRPTQATASHPQIRPSRLPPAAVGLCRSRAIAAATYFTSLTTLC